MRSTQRCFATLLRCQISLPLFRRWSFSNLAPLTSRALNEWQWTCSTIRARFSWLWRICDVLCVTFFFWLRVETHRPPSPTKADPETACRVLPLSHQSHQASAPWQSMTWGAPSSLRDQHWSVDTQRIHLFLALTGPSVLVQYEYEPVRIAVAVFLSTLQTWSIE